MFSLVRPSPALYRCLLSVTEIERKSNVRSHKAISASMETSLVCDQIERKIK